MALNHPNPLRIKLLALMGMRVALAIAFLTAATWFQISEGILTRAVFYPVYAIAGTIGALTVFYALILNRVKNLRLFTFVQLSMDVALTTVIVYVTGAFVSYLSVLYALLIMGGAILLGRQGGYYTASVSSIAYGVLMDLDFYNVLPSRFKVISSSFTPAWEDVITTTATNMLAFFTVAYLTGYLSEKASRMEKELEEKGIDFGRLEKLNRLIVDNIPSGVMTLDENGRITSFNRAASDITGYALKDVYYRNSGEIFPGLTESVLQGFHASASGGRAERSFNLKDGKEVYLGFTASPGQGGQSGDMTTIVIFQDLTQIRAMEDELRRDDKLKALGELSAAIAHEIRNPLASISGSIQVLGQELRLDGEQTHLMEIVMRESKRLNSLITDFLLFAKPAKEKGRRFDVSELVDETCEIFTNTPQRSGAIKIVKRLNGRFLVEGDRRQISQVFWNLFLNAASAMPRGGTLTIALAERSFTALPVVSDPSELGRVPSSIRRCVEIEVGDTGAGIPRENMDKIFDPFFSTKDSGTGLGLALVHRIIESHGGRIEVESELTKGTVFRIMLPLVEAEAAESALS